MDVLPLYIVLMLFLPVILWLLKWRADVALGLSVLLYALTWQFDWFLTAYPSGFWIFNPFCWQLLFVFGAWCALGRRGAHVPPPVVAGDDVDLHCLSAVCHSSVTLTWAYPADSAF